eukprot:552717_1
MSALAELNSLISYFEAFGEAINFETHLYYDDYMLKHIASNCEGSQRVEKSFEALNAYGLLSSKNVQIIKPTVAKKCQLLLSHSQKHIDNMLNINTNNFKSVEISYNKYTPKASLLAAGACINLFDSIMSSNSKCENGFALIRPPGHHCEYDKPMGFCVFNNIVVGINCLRNKYGNNIKILIVDFDVHAGNGTSSAFINCDNILYFSIHRYDNGQFYPYSGRIKEDGNNGKNINVPINVYSKKGYGNDEYLLIFKDILLPIAKEFEPNMIVISAGFDSCIGDPLGGMTITPHCFGVLVKLLMNICKKCAVVLEGGYEYRMVARCCCTVFYALLNRCNILLDECKSFEMEFNRFIGQKDKQKIGEFEKWKQMFGHLLVDEKQTKKHKKKNIRKEKLLNNDADGKYNLISDFIKLKKNKMKDKCDNMKECKILIRKVLEIHVKYWGCLKPILKKYQNEY